MKSSGIVYISGQEIEEVIISEVDTTSLSQHSKTDTVRSVLNIVDDFNAQLETSDDKESLILDQSESVAYDYIKLSKLNISGSGIGTKETATNKVTFKSLSEHQKSKNNWFTITGLITLLLGRKRKKNFNDDSKLDKRKKFQTKKSVGLGLFLLTRPKKIIKLPLKVFKLKKVIFLFMKIPVWLFSKLTRSIKRTSKFFKLRNARKIPVALKRFVKLNLLKKTTGRVLKSEGKAAKFAFKMLKEFIKGYVQAAVITFKTIYKLLSKIRGSEILMRLFIAIVVGLIFVGVVIFGQI